MATAAVTNTFVAGTAAEAAEVNTNFTNLVTFLNNSVVHLDGSKAMSADFDAGTNKIVNLSAGTASTDAANIANVNAVLPVGMMTAYGGSSAPSLWALCDGTAVSRVTYSDLFAVVGTAFGVGDGSTTFNLPDLRDKYPIGKSGTVALGAAVGSNDAVAVAHTHTFVHGHTSAAHVHSVDPPATAVTADAVGNSSVLIQGTSSSIGGGANRGYDVITIATSYAGFVDDGETLGSVNIAAFNSAGTSAVISDNTTGDVTAGQSPTSTAVNTNRPASVGVNWIIRTGV